MALPSDANIDFLICDDVREETAQKLTLIGFFPTPQIWLDQKATAPFNFPLSFIFILRDGSGDFTPSCRLIDPSGAPVFARELANFTKDEKEAHVVALSFTSLTVSLLGVYRISLELNGREYERLFNIGQR